MDGQHPFLVDAAREREELDEPDAELRKGPCVGRLQEWTGTLAFTTGSRIYDAYVEVLR